MPTLDLMDVTTNPPERLDSVTLNGNGTLTFEGNMIKEIFQYYLENFRPTQVFDNFTDWSNGYQKLQLKAGE